MIKEKRGQMWETLIPWLIVIGVLVLTFVLYLTITGRLDSASDFFKNFFNFRQ